MGLGWIGWVGWLDGWWFMGIYILQLYLIFFEMVMGVVRYQWLSPMYTCYVINGSHLRKYQNCAGGILLIYLYICNCACTTSSSSRWRRRHNHCKRKKRKNIKGITVMINLRVRIHSNWIYRLLDLYFSRLDLDLDISRSRNTNNCLCRYKHWLDTANQYHEI